MFNMNNLLSIYPEETIRILLKDKILLNKFLYYIYIKFNDYYFYKNYSFSINNYIFFVPLPNTLVYDNNYEGNNNYYKFIGNNSSVLKGNLIIPHYSLSPIPFSFPYKFNNNYFLTYSNIFYYEILITSEMFNEDYENKYIILGYGNNTYNNSKVGDNYISIGFNTKSCSIKLNGREIKCFDKKICTYNDTIGAGLMYDKKNKFTFFLTINGELILPYVYFKTEYKLTPLMNINYPSKIKVNFGKENFLYNIKNMQIKSEVLTTQNEFIKTYNLSKFFSSQII